LLRSAPPCSPIFFQVFALEAGRGRAVGRPAGGGSTRRAASGAGRPMVGACGPRAAGEAGGQPAAGSRDAQQAGRGGAVSDWRLWPASGGIPQCAASGAEASAAGGWSSWPPSGVSGGRSADGGIHDVRQAGGGAGGAGGGRRWECVAQEQQKRGRPAGRWWELVSEMRLDGRPTARGDQGLEKKG
jgi:hypothetical protein